MLLGHLLTFAFLVSSFEVWAESGCDDFLLSDFELRLNQSVREKLGVEPDIPILELQTEDTSRGAIKAKNLFLLTDQYVSGIVGTSKQIAFARYAVKADTLRFDIKVESPLRHLGVYQYLLAYVLNQNSEVQKIASLMPWISKNTQVFYAAFLKEAEISEREFYKRRASELLLRNGVRLREAAIRALEEMPAYRVRKALGFGRVAKLGLDFNFTNDFAFQGGVPVRKRRPFAIRFVVVRGEQDTTSELDIEVGLPVPNGDFAIDKNGRWKAISEANLVDLGDYLTHETESRHFRTEKSTADVLKLKFPWQKNP